LFVVAVTFVFISKLASQLFRIYRLKFNVPVYYCNTHMFLYVTPLVPHLSSTLCCIQSSLPRIPQYHCASWQNAA
jgi:hypothetical protein